MMNFLERILRMPRAVMTVMALLLIAGFGAYQTLPKESFPAIDIPYFYVSVSQTGVSPRDAERLLAKPIEDRLEDLDGLQNISSTATTGHASIFLEFDVNVDSDNSDPFYGAGFRIGLTEHFSMRLEVERYEVVDTDIDTASIGLQANF